MTAQILTQKELKELLHYCPDTGIFTWLVARGRVSIGHIAGQLMDGYTSIRIDRRMYRAHRLAWLYVTGNFPADQLDHINHVRDDNRFFNLREATDQVNGMNKSISSRNTSGVTGVYKHACGKWQVEIRDKKRYVYGGIYADFFDAVCVRKAAEVMYGYHENHGK